MRKGRRNFLKTSAGAAVGLAAWPAVNRITMAQEPPATQENVANRQFAPVQVYLLELDKEPVGWIGPAVGENATSDVAEQKLGAERIQHKHIPGVKFEAITFKCGTGLAKGFYSWLAATISGRTERRDGVIHIADNNRGTILNTLTFHQALISEIGFPAVNERSKDQRSLTIKVEPEWTSMGPGGGKLDSSRFPPGTRWLSANFRLTIDGINCGRGFDGTCAVRDIQDFSFKQKAVDDGVEQRIDEKAPANLEMPNLVITLPETKAEDFLKWQQQKPDKNGMPVEKNGMLEYLAPDFKTTIFQLDFRNLGIFKIVHTLTEVAVSMYMGSANFNAS
ncbi:MAG TPA: phage tail protein [Pyrinomonadaceae bacterium]|jgi:hypothetical protein